MKEEKRVFEERVMSATRIAIVLPKMALREAVCSGLALYHYILTLGKEVTVFWEKEVESSLRFLPGTENVQDKFFSSKDVLVSVTIPSSNVSSVKYEVLDQRINFYITQVEKTVSDQDITFLTSGIKYDLLIVLGAADLASIGSLYSSYPQVFFNNSIINIDSQIENENFGQLNLVFSKSVGTSQIVADIFFRNEVSFNQAMMDCLYAGILEASDSFRSPKATPRTLLLASKLIEMGANKKEIIKNLYKANDFSLVKLWGKVMSLLNYEKKSGLCYGVFDSEFLNSNDVSDDLMRVLFEKTRKNYNRRDTLLFLFERDSEVYGLAQNSHTHILSEVLGGSMLGGILFFRKKGGLQEVLDSVLGEIRKELEELYDE